MLNAQFMEDNDEESAWPWEESDVGVMNILEEILIIKTGNYL